MSTKDTGCLHSYQCTRWRNVLLGTLLSKAVIVHFAA